MEWVGGGVGWGEKSGRLVAEKGGDQKFMLCSEFTHSAAINSD